MSDEASARTVAALRRMAAKLLAPPSRMTPSEWAQARRVLDHGSAEPGPWRNSRTPYLVEPMDMLSPACPVELVVMQTAIQVGKTEVLLNSIGHGIDVSACPMMMVLPTIDIARDVSKGRLAPMLRTTPTLREKVPEPRSRDAETTMTLRKFPGGFLRVAGANSAASLASTPIQRLYLDEVDRYPVDVDGEGDPVSLAEGRTSTFKGRRKVLMTSSPTIKGKSRIEKAYLASDQRRYFVPCPHCDHYQTLKWSQVTWDDGTPQSAYYVCAANGCVIQDHEKSGMLQRGRWEATSDGNERVRGYHLSALYAPHGLGPSWGDLAEQYEQAKGDPAQLKTFRNTRLAETWDQDDGATIDEDSLLARVEEADWASELPHDVVLLTAGCDVQADRLEVEVVGWAPGFESWSVDYRIIRGDVTQAEVWQALEELLLERFAHPAGVAVPIGAACIDSGHYTNDVYRFTRSRLKRRWWAVKGRAGNLPVWPTRASQGGKGHAPVFVLGVDNAKGHIYDRLSIEAPGPGYCHFPDARGEEYFQQLTSETLQRRFHNGRAKLNWVQSRKRNEALDCRVYAYAALHGWMASGRTLEKAQDRLLRVASAAPQGELESSPARRDPEPRRRARPGWMGGRKPGEYWSRG